MFHVHWFSDRAQNFFRRISAAPLVQVASHIIRCPRPAQATNRPMRTVFAVLTLIAMASSSSASSTSSAASSSVPGAFARPASCSRSDCKKFTSGPPDELHPVFGPCETAMEKHRRQAASALLYSIQNHGQYTFPHEGLAAPETERDIDGFLRIAIHPGLGDARLVSSTAQLISGSDGHDEIKQYAKSRVEAGVRMVGHKCPHELAANLVAFGGDRARQKRTDAYDLDVPLNYFHEGCPLVEPDKSKMQPWRNKNVKVCGAYRRMSCHPRLRKGTKAMLVDDYFMSDVCHQYEALNPGVSLTSARAMSCICPCMKVGARAPAAAAAAAAALLPPVIIIPPAPSPTPNILPPPTCNASGTTKLTRCHALPVPQCRCNWGH